jgi:hypothetical protein
LSYRRNIVGELSKQRIYAIHSVEFKELARLRLNSPTVSGAPKAHRFHRARLAVVQVKTVAMRRGSL